MMLTQTPDYDALDGVDCSLLEQLQLNIPFSRRPFLDIGHALGIPEDDVIARIQQLKQSGIIRQIGPILNPHMVGYQTSLAAMKVPPNMVSEVADLVQKDDMISHCYERDHEFNVWFTLAVKKSSDLQGAVSDVYKKAGSEIAFALPALQVFKLRTFFSPRNNLNVQTGNHPSHTKITNNPITLSEFDCLILNKLQNDLPLIPKPFSAIAFELNVNELKLLERYRYLSATGVIRRFSAAVRHDAVGFNHNAMICWSVPKTHVEDIGKKLSSYSQISHCYERATNQHWPYNLFAMTHAQTEEAQQQLLNSLSEITGQYPTVVLKSIRAMKKARVKYVVKNEHI